MRSKALIVVVLIILAAVVYVYGRHVVRSTSKYLQDMEELHDSLAVEENSEIHSDVEAESLSSDASRTNTVGPAGGGTETSRAVTSSSLTESPKPMPKMAASAEVSVDKTEVVDSSTSNSAEQVVEEPGLSSEGVSLEGDTEDYTLEDIFGDSDDSEELSEEGIVSNISDRVDRLIADNENFVEADKPIIMEYLAIQIADSPQDFTNISDGELLQRMNYVVQVETIR